MSSAESSAVSIVLGAQWGDEGKGKLVDILADDHAICARYNGGSNAGHTIVRDGVKFAVHLLPSGLVSQNEANVIGNGVVLYIPKLKEELQQLDKNGVSWKGRLLVSDRAHLVFDFHRAVDGRDEDNLGDAKIGTTRQGIGPTYAGKMDRRGIRVHHLYEPETFRAMFERALKAVERRFGDLGVDVDAEVARYTGEYAEFLKPMVVDCSAYLSEALEGGKRLLIESANAAMLDIDHGTYPYVTSSSPCIGGALTGLGLSALRLRDAKVCGIVKAYTTRVGEGPFPTELSIEEGIGKHLKDVGHEYGTTTKRPRRCGWLDLVMVHYSHRLNGYSSINLTKLDVLDQLDEIKVCISYTLDGKETKNWPASLHTLGQVQCNWVTLPGWKSDITGVRKYSDLPENARRYVEFIEKQLNVPVEWIGVGPGNDAMIEK